MRSKRLHDANDTGDSLRIVFVARNSYLAHDTGDSPAVTCPADTSQGTVPGIMRVNKLKRLGEMPSRFAEGGLKDVLRVIVLKLDR